MKKSLTLSLLILIKILSCEKPKETGIEIYQVNIPYPDFTKESPTDCYYCFELKKENLHENPIIAEQDIEHFDWEKQQITLTENGRKKIAELHIPLQGLAVGIVLNGEPIYGFWFWNFVSSFGCDRVYAYPKEDFKIKFGLPNDNTFGSDPRFNNRLEKYIDEKTNHNSVYN